MSKETERTSRRRREASEKIAAGRFAYDGLDRTIHERARLSILSSLAAHGQELTFNDLKDLCQLTDGNLSRHLAILEEARLVSVRKGFQGNRPQTTVTLSAAGRRRFAEYIEILESVVEDARECRRETARRSDRAPEGLSPA